MTDEYLRNMTDAFKAQKNWVEEKMKLPKMILFDYGQTLMDESYFDGVAGTAAVMEYAEVNKYGKTPEEIQEQADEINKDLGRFDMSKRHLCTTEVPACPFQAYLYESNGIRLSVSYSEAARIFWDAAAPAVPTPGISEFLEYLKEKGIRTGVISNLTHSEEALRERIGSVITHEFEFVLTSSTYVFRKPHPRLFWLALEKADLAPEDVWYVGDDPECDVKGSMNVGIHPVWYTGAARNRKENISGITRVSSWTQLREILEQL